MSRIGNYFQSYNGQVLLRLLAAIVVGYISSTALAALLAKALTRWTDMGLANAALYGSLAGFFIYSVIILWVFTVRSQKKLWQQLVGVTVIAAALVYLL